jgi:hypothetical protein
MSWPAPVRTPTATAIYEAAEKERAERPERYRLAPEAVVEKANRHCGAPDPRFAEGWRAGLETLLGSADSEGRLNAVGIRMVLQMATGRLVAGAKIAQYRREHPEVVATQLFPPIVIVGGWRTGTTFLFRLLGSDSRLHAPLPAELVAPWSSAERPANSEITAAASQLLDTLNPDMAFVHPSGPTLPEECVLGMGTDLRNWGFTSMLRLPAYAKWLAGQDFGGSYARYREVLQLLASTDGRRFVLKAPAHTAELRHLVAAFPGAVVVQIHRDIVETVASGSSLFAVYRSTYSDDVDPVDVGRQQADQTELWLRRAVEFRASAAAGRARFVDLDYRELIAGPAAALTAIYRAADMEPPAELNRFVTAYHAMHPADGTRHRYTPADFGFDENALRERFGFLAEM